MAIFTSSFLGYLSTVIVALALVVITFFKWRYQYWKRRNFPYLEPKFPFGCLENPFNMTMSLSDKIIELYKEIKSRNLKHCGIYCIANPVYYPVDLEYIKNITTRHFSYFVDRSVYYNEKSNPISGNIVNIGGVKWKNLRTKITPCFTLGKIKSMFQILMDCGSVLEKVMHEKVMNRQSIYIKDIAMWYTVDIIGICAFGLDLNTLQDKDTNFKNFIKKIIKKSKARALLSLIANNIPAVGHLFGIRNTSKDVEDLFTKMIGDTVKHRETNNVTRNDILQGLIELKNREINWENGDNRTLTMSEVIAQSYGFFTAGFNAAACTLTYALYELAANSEIQEKAREEVFQFLKKYKGEMCYDALNEMTYLGQIIDETLRMYPPIPYTSRMCVEDYKIPGEDLVIEKGTRIYLPLKAIHYDEEFYPQPNVFDPERFNEENKRQRHQYAHIPFGEGPRICIGMKFAIMENKIAIATILKNYKFCVSKRTQIPPKMTINSFFLSAEADIWLDFEKM